MDANPALSVNSESTDATIGGAQLASTDWPKFPENYKTIKLGCKWYPEFSDTENLQESLGELLGTSWRQREGKKEEYLMYSKYRLGGSVESVFSHTSVQHPEWTILRSSKSQDALTHTTSLSHRERKENELDQTKRPDIVDDVVGDEVMFKSPAQQSPKHKIMDYRPNQSVVIHSSSIAPSQNTLATSEMSNSQSLPDYITQDLAIQNLESPTYHPSLHDAGNKCKLYRKKTSHCSSSLAVMKDQEMPGLQLGSLWTKGAEIISSSTSEETDSSHSQAAESDESQNISTSLLKAIILEREDEINCLKQLRGVETENLRLVEEKQHIHSENERRRKEFEVKAFNKEREKHDFLNSFDPTCPLVLQRQIVNLKKQINDLQEANESAVQELAKADEEISQQKTDIAKLNAEYNQKFEDSQEEIALLKEKISQMSSRFGESEHYEQGLHKEILQLRSETRTLRTHSHQLNEENHRMKEELWDIERKHERLLKRTAYGMSGKNDGSTATRSPWTNPSMEELHTKSWQSVQHSFHRNDSFKDDGTFSKCKAAFGSGKIKEPWEQKHEERIKSNASPASLDSENTDILIMGYREESPHKPSQTHFNGGACEEMQALSGEDFSSISQSDGNVLWNASHPSPKSAHFSVSSCKNSNITSSHAPETVVPRRPFAPKNVSDLKVGNLVKFSRPPAGKISKGSIQYMGRLQGRDDVYLGVELEGSEFGKHDGTFQGTRYFLCKPNKGVFVNFSKLIMAWD
ncbi:hypothetical protein FKM82_008895 [Ascaphus truei]